VFDAACPADRAEQVSTMCRGKGHSHPYRHVEERENPVIMTIIDQRTRDSLAWSERAACQDAVPDLFFPVSDFGAAQEQITEAKSVCARCPVRADCLHHALSRGEASGIWGGTTEYERRHLRRRRAAVPRRSG
jgi:WhiB family redox-sensing transcriptional regulator